MKKEFILFGASNIALKGAGFLVVPVVMKLLGPEQYGLWVLFSPIVTYSLLFSLGVPNAMNRLVPILNGKGSTFQVEDIHGVALFSMLGAVVVVSVVFVCVVYVGPYQYLRIAALALALLLLAQNFHQFIHIRCRSEGRFNLVSKGSFIQAVIYPVFALLGVTLAGLPGFIVGQAIALVLSAYSIVWLGGLRLYFRKNKRLLFDLIKEGFPIAMLSLIGGFLEVTDRLIIGTMLGTKQAGYYGLSIVVNSVVLIIPTLLAQLFYPKMAYEYGRNSPATLYKLFRKNQKWNFLSLLLIPTLALIGGEIFIPIYLPDYLPGVHAMEINVFVAVILAIGMPWSDILLIEGHHRIRLMIIMVSLFFNATLGFAAAKLGYGIEGVAAATLFSAILMTLLLYGNTKKFLVRLRSELVVQ